MNEEQERRAKAIIVKQLCAESLKVRLEENDCLDVEVKKQPVRECVVTGKSYLVTPTSEILRDCVGG